MTELSLKIYHVVLPGTDKEPRREYFFTTEDAPVSFRGRQYIPLNEFDAIRWGLIPPRDVGANALSHISDTQQGDSNGK